jgi:4-amino-4-deoxy-L-arabinose transferase-like glycosyltransferase
MRVRDIRPFGVSSAALAVTSICTVAASGALTRQLLASWPELRGYEAESVARAIAGGHGFSFPANERWLFAPGSPGQYFATAWVDPLFSYLLAAWFWLLGERAHLAAGLMNIAFFAGCIAVAYAAGRRLGGAAAGCAVALLLCGQEVFRLGFLGVNNAALSALLVSATALATLHYFARGTTRAACALGVMTGVTLLGCPAALLFPAALAGAVALNGQLDRTSRAWHVAALCMACAALVAPWALRNTLTFGRFVPLRTGGGQIAWVGTVGLGETLMPGISATPVPPPWRESTPGATVQRTLDAESRFAIHDFQMAVSAAQPPPGYAAMNEADRDAYYMREALRFVREQPVLTARLAFEKLKLLAAIHGRIGMGVALAALLGALLGALRPQTRALGMLAVAYVMPFSLIVAYFPRYRLSIEPVLAMLAVTGVSVVVAALRRAVANGQVTSRPGSATRRINRVSY